jgi:hypothetical protein
MGSLNRPQPSSHFGERLIPPDLDELPLPANQRRVDPIRIVVEFAKRRTFGAQVAVTEYVRLVTPDGDHPVRLMDDGQPTGRLTQRADA